MTRLEDRQTLIDQIAETRAGGARQAAQPAARREDDAVEGGRDAERHALGAADLHHLAEAAAMLAAS